MIFSLTRWQSSKFQQELVASTPQVCNLTLTWNCFHLVSQNIKSRLNSELANSKRRPGWWCCWWHNGAVLFTILARHIKYANHVHATWRFMVYIRVTAACAKHLELCAGRENICPHEHAIADAQRKSSRDQTIPRFTDHWQPTWFESLTLWCTHFARGRHKKRKQAPMPL